jgi:hypothetical protein
MKNIKEQIEELMRYYKVNTYKELAEKLEINPANVNYWINQNKIPFKYLQVLGNVEEHKKEVLEICNDRINEAKRELANALDRPRAIQIINDNINELSNVQILEILETVLKYKTWNLKGK